MCANYQCKNRKFQQRHSSYAWGNKRWSFVTFDLIDSWPKFLWHLQKQLEHIGSHAYFGRSGFRGHRSWYTFGLSVGGTLYWRPTNKFQPRAFCKHHQFGQWCLFLVRQKGNTKGGLISESFLCSLCWLQSAKKIAKHYSENLSFRRIEVRIGIWHIFGGDWVKVKNSKIKPT